MTYVTCCLLVSDKPGNHNFELLKKIVLPDGSVLRAQLPGRPTRDCLFVDPARDGIRFRFLNHASIILVHHVVCYICYMVTGVGCWDVSKSDSI